LASEHPVESLLLTEESSGATNEGEAGTDKCGEEAEEGTEEPALVTQIGDPKKRCRAFIILQGSSDSEKTTVAEREDSS
jgi:hypothetical protein